MAKAFGVIVSGAAGFIGSHVVDSLLGQGFQVLGIDNMALGRTSNLRNAQATGRFTLLKEDLGEVLQGKARNVVENFCVQYDVGQLWHMAANSDIAKGAENPAVDLRDTMMTTYSCLELARTYKVPAFYFASTSAVYGDRQDLLTENSGPLLPISNYGAMKLASEGMISAACEAFLRSAVIFRFPNVIGARGTHGALYDFVHRLKVDPKVLRVLGDGQQTKPYLHVSELVQAMMIVAKKSQKKLEFVNVGVGEGLSSVKFIAEEVVRQASPSAKIEYIGGSKGWVGDVPRFQLSVDKIAAYGWRSTLSSDAAVCRAISELISESHEGSL